MSRVRQAHPSGLLSRVRLAHPHFSRNLAIRPIISIHIMSDLVTSFRRNGNEAYHYIRNYALADNAYIIYVIMHLSDGGDGGPHHMNSESLTIGIVSRWRPYSREFGRLTLPGLPGLMVEP